jgi:hypothetical protein
MGKLVEMSVRDEKTNALKVEMVEVKSVTVNIRNNDRRSVRRGYSDVIAGVAMFRPGEVKQLEVSEAAVEELKQAKAKLGKNAIFELTNEEPTPPPEPEEEVIVTTAGDSSDDDSPETNDEEAPRIKRSVQRRGASPP